MAGGSQQQVLLAEDLAYVEIEALVFLLEDHGILRRVGAYKLPNALRMSVGSEEANRLVVSALAEFLSAKDLGRR